MRPRNPPKAIIFDLGDVLFTWSPDTSTKVSAKLMKSILSSTIWMKYECGLLEQDVCYHQIAQHFSIPAFDVAEAFSQARDSLQPNDAMVSFIRDLNKQSQGAIKIYAMSNISKEDWVVLSTKMPDWSMFAQVFTSGHAGMRKPDSEFYHHVLREIKLSPEETLFIDDKKENVLAAKSLGIESLVFDNSVNVIHTLKRFLNDPVKRGFQYLYRHAPHFDSITDTGVDVPDNFSHLLILDAMQDKYALRAVTSPRSHR